MGSLTAILYHCKSKLCMNIKLFKKSFQLKRDFHMVFDKIIGYKDLSDPLRFTNTFCFDILLLCRRSWRF